MKFLQTFITEFKKSLFDFSFYTQAVKTPFKSLLRFTYLLTFFVIFIYTLYFAINAAFILPKLPAYLETLKLRSQQLYPRDLVITIKDGVISTNKKEPLYLDVSELQKNPGYDHFITIDTKATPKTYPTYKTLLLVTRHALVYPIGDPQQGAYETRYAKDLENTTITYLSYQKFIQRFYSFVDRLPGLLPWLLFASVFIVPLIASIFVVVWRLINLVLLSVIVWTVSHIFGNKYTFKEVYKMGMYGLAVPVSLTFVFDLFGVFIPLLFTASFLLWMVIVLSKLDRTA